MCDLFDRILCDSVVIAKLANDLRRMICRWQYIGFCLSPRFLDLIFNQNHTRSRTHSMLLTACRIDWLTDWLADWLIDWLTDWYFYWVDLFCFIVCGVVVGFCFILFSLLSWQVLVRQHLPTPYRVPVRCMPLQRLVLAEISRCAVVIQAINFSCHMQNNWTNSKHRGNGAAVRRISTLAWNLHGNFSMRVKLKAMPAVLWIYTTIESDERYANKKEKKKNWNVQVECLLECESDRERDRFGAVRTIH